VATLRGELMMQKEWTTSFQSAAPEITLLREVDCAQEKLEERLKGMTESDANAVRTALPLLKDASRNDGFHVAIGAARSCYAKKLITPAEASKKSDLAEEIAESTYAAKHFTPYMHRAFVFGMKDISRQAIWSFFHSHPFYNSEQVSQRYVEMGKRSFIVPRFDNPEAQQVYEDAITDAIQLYDRLRNDLLMPVATQAFFDRFPGRKGKAAEYKKDIEKKTQEIARYVSPIGMHAHMYHTVNLITLARYRRLAMMPDCPQEVSWIVEKMVDTVKEHEPSLASLLDEAIPQEALIEWKARKKYTDPRQKYAETKQYIREFDSEIGQDRCARLTDYKPDGVKQMAAAVRDVLGLPSSSLSDTDAIKIVLDPAYNTQRGDTQNLNHVSKLARAQFMPSFTFMLRLSHTADSQEQRQRMSPAVRPMTDMTVTDEPDYISPILIRAAGTEVEHIYDDGMRRRWKARERLLDLGATAEQANWILPNALTVRLRQSVDLLNFMDADEKRECILAQEEINKAYLEKRLDVERVHPELRGYFGPPCYRRAIAEETPFCPEGKRYCGVPIWLGLSPQQKHQQFGIDNVIRQRLI